MSFSTQASPARSPMARALASATSWVASHSARYPCRSKHSMMATGSFQATSCSSSAAACRVAATRLSRSSRLQVSVSSVLAKLSTGALLRSRSSGTRSRSGLIRYEAASAERRYQCSSRLIAARVACGGSSALARSAA